MDEGKPLSPSQQPVPRPWFRLLRGNRRVLRTARAPRTPVLLILLLGLALRHPAGGGVRAAETLHPQDLHVDSGAVLPLASPAESMAGILFAVAPLVLRVVLLAHKVRVLWFRGVIGGRVSSGGGFGFRRFRRVPDAGYGGKTVAGRADISDVSWNSTE